MSVKLRHGALWFALVMATACGGPLPEEMEPVDSSIAASSEELAVEDGEAGIEPWCEGVIEACVPGYSTCGVRCCDGALFHSTQLCGNCRTWAIGACANHLGPRNIRWTP